MGLLQSIPLRKSIFETLAYFDKFDYPLSLDELRFWQTGSDFSLSEIFASFTKRSPYYYLDGRDKLIKVRQKRALYSQKKLQAVTPFILDIGRLPFVKAVFITGALAMSNSPPGDDIDILVVTRRYSLWLARPLVIIFLKLRHLRRDPHLPEHSSARVSGKVCDNLWLDEDHLLQINQSLYTAHELLQAKCLFDRGGIHYRFIDQNSWAKDYLPVAFREILKQTKSASVNNSSSIGIVNFMLYIINFIFFLFQYLYMRPRLTSEKVGLGYAYFHPNSVSYLS
jgi:hypothetical protein